MKFREMSWEELKVDFKKKLNKYTSTGLVKSLEKYKVPNQRKDDDMHCCGYMVTETIPTENEIEEILKSYESVDGSTNFCWDWYEIGGRYGGKLKIYFNPDDNEDKWYCGEAHERNFKYFISNALAEWKEMTLKSGYWDELQVMLYMGLRKYNLYVDGAYYDDIENFDVTSCYFLIDDSEKKRVLYVRDSCEHFDEKVKELRLEGKFITVIDLHT